MTDEEKVARVIQWLTESHLFAHGGYPYDYAIHAGRLFIAELDDAKERARTEIVQYDLDSIAHWYDSAVEYMNDHNDCEEPWPNYTGQYFGEWTDAFHETKPLRPTHAD